MFMVVGNFALLLSVGLATPIDLLPCKNSIEDLFFKEKGMSTWQNFYVTFFMISVCTALGLFVGSIGEAMTIVGCIFSPLLCFQLPIFFYLPSLRDQPWYSFERLKCYLTSGVMLVASVLSLLDFLTERGEEAC